LPPPTSAAWPWFSRGAAISAIRDLPREGKDLPALLFFAVAVYFVSLGNSAIWDANEAFYVETPREMLEAHDFINPTFNYLPRFNKPVLSYWIVALFYQLFGISVTVQRFAIALGAMVIIACAYVLARAAADDSAPGIRDPGSAIRDEGLGIRDPGSAIRDEGLGIRDEGLGIRDDEGSGIRDEGSGIRDEGSGIRQSAALWAAVGLAAAPRLVMFARRIFIDIWITAFLSLTLAFFALSELYPHRRRLYLALMYGAIGLGVLTKGPVAIALPALAFLLYLAVRRELARVTQMMLPLGLLIVAAIVVPWYAALYNEQGWTYIKSFLISENVERFTSGVGVRQPRPPWFYLPIVLSDSFPWSLLLPCAAVAAWKTRTRIETLLWCWIAAIVGFFSLSVGKQDLYIFPIVSAVAALGGLAIARGLSDARWRTWLSVTLAVAGALLALAGGAVLYLFETAGRVYALDAALIVGAVGVAGGVLTVFLGAARRPGGAALSLVAAVVAVNWAFVIRVLPEFERYKPVPEFSRVLQERLQPGDVVVHYQVSLPSMVYYLRRHVDQYVDEEPFVGAMVSAKHVYAVLSDDDYAALAPRMASKTCIIDRRPTFEVKLRQVLARQPLPELLLISNRCH
jgi:4-amino-4-deoxy-L-arabinose transferase-like glycosyltransferase